MKKLIIGIMTVVLFIISGCSQKTQENNLGPIELNEQGELISQLLNDNNSYPIFLSYDLKEDCKGAKVELWEWKDHRYESVYAHYGQVKKGEGNILVDLKIDPVSMKAVLQDESGSSTSSTYPDEPVKIKDDQESYSRGMVSLSEKTSFQIDEEIPVLIIQTKKVTDGTSTMGLSLDAYKEPEKYITKDMLNLYAITVKFQSEAL